MAYIDRDKVLNILRKRQRIHAEDGDGGCADSLWEMCEAIAVLPTADAVEVVRCKDCVHGQYSKGGYLCEYDKYAYYAASHFCSYGERFEEGGE